VADALPLMSPIVQVFGRRQRRPNHTLGRRASEKRQGTKSRDVGFGRPCRKLSYGDLDGERAASMFARGERWRDCAAWSASGDLR
jgi:hypothetical protein